VSTGLLVGAGGGIGSACAHALDGSTEPIILAGRRRESLDGVAAELQTRTTVVPADVANTEGRDAILAAIEGSIGWVVLASGIPLRHPLRELDDEQITRAFATNLVGPALLLRRLLELDWEDGASITVIGSISASRSLPRRAVYSSTKAGLEHLARSLAAELGPTGIRVNVVSPGVIETPFIGDDSAALDEWAKARVPVGRLGAPEEVASTVRYLVIDAPAYLTGARIPVAGGAEALA
jgi:NAD(P)-dependent dehydrogenase (short-subunit alcohol dehydrogenase family)